MVTNVKPCTIYEISNHKHLTQEMETSDHALECISKNELLLHHIAEFLKLPEHFSY
jgi:hypothetical protein